MKKLFIIILCTFPFLLDAQVECRPNRATIIATTVVDSLPGGDSAYYFKLPTGKYLDSYSIEVVATDTIEDADIGIFLQATNQSYPGIDTCAYVTLTDSLTMEADTIPPFGKYFTGEIFPYNIARILIHDNGCTEGAVTIIAYPVSKN